MYQSQDVGWILEEGHDSDLTGVLLETSTRNPEQELIRSKYHTMAETQTLAVDPSRVIYISYNVN